ncbi:MAG: transposase, partial [Streptomycetaceae bacterium]|nr:transposase [Streptomycetaceae bacterium]
FRTGSPWRDVPEAFGSWSRVYDRFAQWRDAGVFAAVMEAVIAEAARRGQVDLSLVSVDSTIARAHHDAAGMVVDKDVLSALEKAAETEKGHTKGTKAAQAAGRGRGYRARSGARTAPPDTAPTPGPFEGGGPEPLPRRPDQQDPPVGRTALPPAVVRAHPRAGRRQPAVFRRTGRSAGARAGRAPAHPARRGGR